MKLSSIIVALLMAYSSAFAQAPQVEKWNLQKCVEYAMQNNISVRQADLQIRFADLDLHHPTQTLAVMWVIAPVVTKIPQHLV